MAINHNNSVKPTTDGGESTPTPLGFDSTHWSVVVQAQESVDPQAEAALTYLCQRYWYPIFAYIRRQSANTEEAEDLTQEFFTRFLEKGFVREVEQSKGKFRTFLLACCNHFLSNQRKQKRAFKRGGGQTILSLDVESAKERYLLEPSDSLAPDSLFTRRWALTLLEESLAQLEKEYEEKDKKVLFDKLKSHLIGDPNSLSYADVARRLGMSEVAVKKAAQRLRERCRTIVREQVLSTVQGPEDIENEISELFSVLGR